MNVIYIGTPDPSIIDIIKALDGTKQVLDVGCGLGRHATLFAKAGHKVTALDTSIEAINYLQNECKKHHLQIETILGNYLEEQFNAQVFDVIISYNVIYHGTQQDFLRAINLCKKYLKKGGLFYFTCPTRKDGKYNAGECVAPHTFLSLNSVHPGDIHYFTSKEEMMSALADVENLTIKIKEHVWDYSGVEQFSSYYEVYAWK